MPMISQPSFNPIAEIFGNADRKVAQQAAIQALNAPKTGKLDPARAAEVAKDFEAVFLAQMLQNMIPEESEDGLFSNQEGDEIFRGMMMEEYAKEISKAGGIGIASYIERELLGQNQTAIQPRNYQIPIGAYEKTSQQEAPNHLEGEML